MVMSLRSKWAVGKAVRAGLAVEGAYLNRYVTDEQRSRRPIFNATLRAAASWLFFRVACSTRMTQIWALYRQSGSDRLEKQPTDRRTGKPPSHSATPELLQLLTSSIARIFKPKLRNLESSSSSSSCSSSVHWDAVTGRRPMSCN